MGTNYYRIVVVVTLAHPQAAQDVVMRTSRIIPFQPTEGMSLVFTNDNDEENTITLGAPSYNFKESCFIDYQEDESITQAHRDGTYNHNTVTLMIQYYESFGFERVLQPRAIEQRREAVA